MLLTGESGAGKSTACARLVEMAFAKGMSVGGIVAPAVYDHARAEIGIEVVHARSAERRLLATKPSRSDAVSADGQASIAQGVYRFDESALGWSVTRVVQDLASCLDLVVIDEIGPLELEQGLGYRPALDVLGSAVCAAVVLIVRPGLVGALEERLRPLQARVVSLTRCNRDAMPARLLREVCGED